MLCDNTDEKHTHITNICTSCLSVIETCNESMGLNLKESSKKTINITIFYDFTDIMNILND